MRSSATANIRRFPLTRPAASAPAFTIWHAVSHGSRRWDSLCNFRCGTMARNGCATCGRKTPSPRSPSRCPERTMSSRNRSVRLPRNQPRTRQESWATMHKLSPLAQSPGVSTPKMNGNSLPPPPSVPPPAAAAVDGGALTQALQITRDSLAVLQRMQEQTSNLHRQFLDGQDTAQRTVHLLVEQQQRLLQAALGMEVSLLAALPLVAAPGPAQHRLDRRTARPIVVRTMAAKPASRAALVELSRKCRRSLPRRNRRPFLCRCARRRGSSKSCWR